MMNILRIQAALVLVTILCSASAYGLPVIPGGVGFGIDTVAGRGGTIYRVTNLAASGPGSLQECVTASGPRTCVFEVSGTIRLTDDLAIYNPNLTIAGQTAPAPGIMIRGSALGIYTSDVLVQHITIRAGDDPIGYDADTRDALKIGSPPNKSIQNIVVDHCSVSWGLDENLDVFGTFDNITLSNNLVSEPLHNSLVNDGTQPQGYNSLVGAARGRIFYINNLFAHSIDRNPLSNAEDFVFVNNVVYNRKYRAVYIDNNYGLITRNSIVGNVFVEGPDYVNGSGPVYIAGEVQFSPSWLHPGTLLGTKVYVADNASGRTTSDSWSVVTNTTKYSRSDLESSGPSAWPAGLMPMSTANDRVLDHVIGNAGSRPAQRSAVDARVVTDVRNGTGKIINCVSSDGSSRCSKNGGGWPQLAQNTRVLNLPADPNGDDDGDGYTNLEEWLHSFAAEVEGGVSAVDSSPKRPNPPTLQPAQ